MALAYLKLEPSADRMEGRTAARWLQRWMGEAAYATVWQPRLTSTFGALAESITVPWIWPRIHDRTTALGYLRGGFQQLYDRLAEETAAGGELRFGLTVTGIRRTEKGRLAVAGGDGGQTYDRVISCLPTRDTCRLTPELPDGYRQRYEWGGAFGAHCLILALDQ